MKFELVLFGLGLVLRFARWRNAEFRARLEDRNLVVVLRTADGLHRRLLDGEDVVDD